jgi:hypothetical protein
VGRLQLDGSDRALDDATAFSEGWHALEQQGSHRQRWSRDRMPLPAGARLIVIDIASRSYCWAQHATAAVALLG